MEKLCARVRAEDAAALEVLVRPIRDKALAAVQDFLLLHSRPVSQPLSPPAAPPTSSCAASRDDAGEEEPASVRHSQLQLPAIPPDQSAAESWDNLEEASMTLPGIKATLLLHLDLSITFNICSLKTFGNRSQLNSLLMNSCLEVKQTETLTFPVLYLIHFRT